MSRQGKIRDAAAIVQRMREKAGIVRATMWSLQMQGVRGQASDDAIAEQLKLLQEVTDAAIEASGLLIEAMERPVR